jgi:hypothetical protein
MIENLLLTQIILIIIFGVLLVGKLFFIKKSSEELLLQQNQLLQELIEKQQQPTSTPVFSYSPQPQELPLTDMVEEQHSYQVEDALPFIPRAVKVKSEVNTVDTSQSKFDFDEVEKLRLSKANK